MPDAQIEPFSKFDHGPSTQLVMTVELLALLGKCAAFASANAGRAALTAEEHTALYAFCELAQQTVDMERARPQPTSIREQICAERTIHAFCL